MSAPLTAEQEALAHELTQAIHQADDDDILHKVEQYFENHLHRMEYPEYVAEGWYIGSGPVESACKTVVGQRLKLAGMRWGEEGAHAMCQVRALYRSEKGQWSAFWERDYANRSFVPPTKVTLTQSPQRERGKSAVVGARSVSEGNRSPSLTLRAPTCTSLNLPPVFLS